jgi:O-antigen/teichoic acid export membrane protein
MEPIARLDRAVRGVRSITIGVGISQVILFAASPALTRIYSPDDFGAYAVISVLVVVFGTVAALRLELAIVLPSDEVEANLLTLLALATAAVATGLVSVSYPLWGNWLQASFSDSNTVTHAWVAAPAGLALASGLVLNQLAVRRGRFQAVGIRAVAVATATVLSQLVLGLSGLKAAGLPAGYGIGQFGGAVSLAWGRTWLDLISAVNGLRGAPTLLRRYWRFPVFMVPSGVLNVLGTQIPVLCLAAWYGLSEAGWFGLSQRVLAVPVALVGTSVSHVYLSRFAALVREDIDEARALFWRTSRRLGIIAGVLTVVVMAFSQWSFPLIFGAPWATSGDYGQALGIFVGAQLIGSPLSQTLVVLDRQRWQLFWDIARVGSVSFAFYLSSVAGIDSVKAIWWFSVTSAVLYGMSWLLCVMALSSWRQSKNSNGG